ncbi:GNAT family N-acetyltransferase [Pseudopedobacter sp.]|uniref:GNAT family N-acetyltransferase n=1 Tax=Pseudopedobacter sp. TaxID=1936787 RepID=UPI00333EF9DB
MITLRFAQKEDLKIIHQLAHNTWWSAYDQILSKEQIKTMLDEFYTEGALQLQINNGHRFIIAEEEGNPLGFSSYSETENPDIIKIHKLYIDPKAQGKGIGKHLINKVSQIAQAEGASVLELFVNRNNPALSFYEKIGFKIVKAIDTPYHQYILDDYILHKSL